MVVEQKLVVVVMGENCERTIDMCLESVKEADAIVYCDGGSDDDTMDKIGEFNGLGDHVLCAVINNDYNQQDKGMNGKQRNFYLDYIKKNYPDYWCLVLDADEVVSDLNEIKKFIQVMPRGVYSPKMRHLIGDLSQEDATKEEHFVLHRLFHISMADYYPEKEHPVLIPAQENKVIPYGGTDCTTIWHLAYCPGIFDIKKRYENHSKKSTIHTAEYLKNWYHQHLFGKYPTKSVNPIDLPKSLLDNFGIDKDEIYFANRGLEVKHFLDAIHWKEFFKCKTVCLFGCGKGPRVYALENLGIDATGIEISEYAVKNGFIPHKITIADIIKEMPHKNCDDLVTAYDVLEHIDYNQLDKVINNIIQISKKHILISVPFKETPNCDNDPTHIIKEDRDWWIKKFTDKGLKEVKVPEHFIAKEQLLIFKK